MAAHGSHHRGKTHFWLISVAGNSNFDSLARRIRGQKLADVDRFMIPKDLRPGTLDDLMSLSDDIEKMEMACAATTRKVGGTLQSFQEKLAVGGQLLDQYVMNFSWEMERFPCSKSCRDLAGMICEQVDSVEQKFRELMIAYNDLNTRVNSVERSQNSNLTVRDLSDIVRPADLPALGSVLFTTVLAVVPNFQTKVWERDYETGFGCQVFYNKDNKDKPLQVKPPFKFEPPKDADPKDLPHLLHEAEQQWERELGDIMSAVVPGSSTFLMSDSEYSLYSVTIFRIAAKDFSAKAREARFTIREFTPAPEGTLSGANLLKDLISHRDEARNNLIRFAQQWFPEAFKAWMHLKALRVFIQSLLRFGLPPVFETFVLSPHASGENSKLRQALAEEYRHLSVDDDSSPLTAAATGLSTGKVYPYVYAEIDLNMN